MLARLRPAFLAVTLILALTVYPTPLLRDEAAAAEAQEPDAPQISNLIGKIVFFSSRDYGSSATGWPKGWDLYAINPDGTGLLRLTNGSGIGYLSAPAVSPDGTQIIVGNGKGVKLFGADGSPGAYVTVPGTQAWVNDWSVTGQVLLTVFGSRTDIMFDEELYSLNTATKQFRRLTNDAARNLFAAWSPDGSQIAYMSDYTLWIMNADGSNKRQIFAGEARDLDWSPDGKQIVFESLEVPQSSSDYEFWVINVDGTGRHRITNTPDRHINEPVWSPDGHSVAFSYWTSNYRSTGLGVLDLATGAMRNLTAPAGDEAPFWTAPAPRYAISGRILDQRNVGIPGVSVAYGAGRSVITNASGEYVLEGLSAGTFTLTPSKSGYTFTPASRQVTVPPSKPDINFVGTVNTSVVTGSVKDVARVGIAGVTISGGGRSTTTDSGGGYTLEGLLAGAHTLTPSKSGHAFTPASRPVTVPPNKLGLNFEGQLTSIRGRVTAGHGEPLAGVFVGLLTEGSVSYVMTTTTKVNGNYVFEDIPGAAGYQLRVVLRDQQSKSRIQWGENGLLVAVSTPWLAVSSLHSGIRNIDFADSSLDAGPVPREQLDDLAAMYFHTRQVQDFIRDTRGLGVPDLAPIDYIWANRPLFGGEVYPVVKYEEAVPGIRDIYMSAFASRYAEVSRPMNREWHENFHHLMNMSLGGLRLCATPSGTCTNHGGLDNPDTADSWTEGWAEFWPCVLADYLGQAAPYLYRMSYVPVSLEHNWNVWDRHLGLISREDLAVASLLWDLYDPKEPSDQDDVDLDLKQLWSLLGHTTDDNNLIHMRDVYQRLKRAALVNEDGSAVSIFALDEVFVAHGFYADDDGDRLWDLSEEVGWGGSQGRSNIQPVPNAYLKAVAQDENGRPITEGTVLVNVQHQNSYYDYQARLPLDPGADGMLYMEMPPLRIPVTVTLTIESAGGSSDPLQIRNDDYWSLVEQSTTGYALEHIFVIHYRVHLPMVQR